MKRLTVFYCLVFVACSSPLWSQGHRATVEGYSAIQAQRLGVMYGHPASFFPELQPYQRRDITALAFHSDSVAQVRELSQHRAQIGFLFDDNNDWLFSRKDQMEDDFVQTEVTMADAAYRETKKPLLGLFYRTPAHLLEVNKKAFFVKIDPMLSLGYGRESEEDVSMFSNLRGLRLRGGIDDRVYFQTTVEETQVRFPNYVNQFIQQYDAVPGAGFYKNYNSDFFKVKNGYDFLLATGHIGFNATPHIGVQFGHGRHFIGNGRRSMLLSDFAAPYFHLTLNTQIWKIHYQNIFAELSAVSANAEKGDLLLPKKYMAAHYLGYKINPRLSIGIYEAVVFAREDHFEFQYLNPIIFYRTVEQLIGSPDNVLLGLNVNGSLNRSVQIYGQLIFDEFKFDELVLDNQGWWANKYGVQLGVKMVDVLGIQNLDVQAEYNLARPFTFTHRDSVATYSHYQQPLSHPLGANFEEALLEVRYQLGRRWSAVATIMAAQYGEDSAGQNFGSNILTPHTINRVRDYGNFIGQGVAGNTTLADLQLSYMVFHNAFLDLRVVVRDKESDDSNRALKTQAWQLGFRLNVDRRNHRF